MTVGERIKELCKSNGTTVKALEQELGYGNGSLATSNEKIQAARAIAVADHFNVPLEYLMTGEYKHEEINGAEDFALLQKIHSLNDANYNLLLSMIDTMIASQ